MLALVLFLYLLDLTSLSRIILFLALDFQPELIVNIGIILISMLLMLSTMFFHDPLW